MKLDIAVFVLKTPLEDWPRKSHKGSDFLICLFISYFLHHSFTPHSLNGTITDCLLVNENANLYGTFKQDAQPPYPSVSTLYNSTGGTTIISWHWQWLLVVIFGTRAIWDLPWPCGKILPKSHVCIIHWRLLGMLVPLRPLYQISQTLNLTCIHDHLSVFVPLLYPCSHGPAKWTYLCSSWPPCSSNSSPQVAAAKPTSYHLTDTYLWMDYIWPVWWVQTILRVHAELVPSSSSTRWTWWQRCLSGVYTKFPQYHWLPEMEPVDTCQWDHRWYCRYHEKCKILPESLSISDGPYCASTMLNIPIGICAN